MSVLDVLGVIAQPLAGLAGAGAQMAYNAKQADIQRGWEEHMSNTAYQRATADMRAAGLNPMLAYQQGGATSPGGAAATIGDVGGMMASSVQGAQTIRKQLQLMDAQIEKTKKEGSAAMQNALYTGIRATNEAAGEGDQSYEVLRRALLLELMRAQIGETRSSAELNRWSARTASEALPGVRFQSSMPANWGRLLFQGVGAAASAGFRYGTPTGRALNIINNLRPPR